MPNWCSTNIIIYHDDSEKLKHFDKLIDEWTSKENNHGNGFGLSWLGNIVLNSGIGTVDEGKETDLRCRGDITNKDLYEYQLHINTETAWVPMLKMWVKLLEKYLPDAVLTYTAEESGCELFYTNDPDYEDKYFLDIWDLEGVESSWEYSEDDVKEILNQLLNTNETDVNVLIDKVYKSKYFGTLSIHKWSYAEIDDWD